MGLYLTTQNASELYGVSQRYIQYLACGRKRKKGNHKWIVEPKINDVIVKKSAKNKPKIYVNADELENYFKEKRHV